MRNNVCVRVLEEKRKGARERAITHETKLNNSLPMDNFPSMQVSEARERVCCNECEFCLL